MYNCIYSGHCSQHMCDKSCPTLAETTYLLERNNIAMSSDVFHQNPEVIENYYNMLIQSEGKLKTVISKSTVNDADIITYCSICQKWRGSRLHCSVYNLKYSKYIESLKQSWSSKTESSDLAYTRIWSESAKVLIISNLDYVNFKDFECQTLLTLLQSRASSEFTTIIVTLPISSLVGNSPFFGKLVELMKKAVNS